MEIDGAEILRILGPGTGQDIVWNVFLYIIFFLALITLFIIPDKNMTPTLLMAGVLLFAIVAKLSLATPRNPILERKEFGMMIINIGMFVFPLITWGTTRAKKKNSTGPALATAFVAFVYFFLFWFLVQSR